MSTRSLTLTVVAAVVVVSLPGAGGQATDQWAEARERLARSVAVMPLPAEAEPAATAAEGEPEPVALATPARASEVVPPPRKHRHRYHGVFAPNHKLRSRTCRRSP